jgi:adenosylhomocysteine nucleosidase
MALEIESGEVFQRANIPVLYTGVGKVNAAYTLTRRLAEYVYAGQTLPLVVNFGTAGSGTLPFRSLVVCRAFAQRDMDVSALDFAVGSTPFDEIPALLEFSVPLEGLTQGICGTGDSFVTLPERAPYDLVDMEAFSLAKVCKLYGVGFACVKYITDGADAGAGSAWRENMQSAAQSFLAAYERLLLNLNRRSE